jgi:hypothetical protein
MIASIDLLARAALLKFRRFIPNVPASEESKGKCQSRDFLSTAKTVLDRAKEPCADYK